MMSPHGAMYDSGCPSCKGLDVYAFSGLGIFVFLDPFPFLGLGPGPGVHSRVWAYLHSWVRSVSLGHHSNVI